MANRKHLAILKQGAEVWNQWREKNPHIQPKLDKTDLSGMDLSEANLSQADIKETKLCDAILNLTNFSDTDLYRANLRNVELLGAELSRAELTNTDLSGADLSGANLSHAIISGANLCGVELYGANLRGADLSDASLIYANLVAADLSETWLTGANFSCAKLDYANLTDANISQTVFGYNDLSRTEGLDAAYVYGPSTIGIDTIFLSKGKIPEVFLRGAGVPETLIQYLPSLLSSGIEFYSLFISYSTADEEFAKRLHADLQAKGVRCWFAPHDMRSGKKVHKQIDEAIRTYDRLLLILSPSSMKSSWVETEISKARKREVTDKKQVLYPISLCSFQELRDWECFDSDTGKDSAREIREYFIPDFSNWKDHDSYRKAFDELMKDLNKKVAPSSFSADAG